MAARDADDGRLSEQELLANLVVLLVAGFETTTNLLGNGLAILLEPPELAAALRCGDVAISGFIEEVLRYDSPCRSPPARRASGRRRRDTGAAFQTLRAKEAFEGAS